MEDSTDLNYDELRELVTPKQYEVEVKVIIHATDIIQAELIATGLARLQDKQYRTQSRVVGVSLKNAPVINMSDNYNKHYAE